VIIDVNAHTGVVQGRQGTISAEELCAMARAAGIDHVVASEASAGEGGSLVLYDAAESVRSAPIGVVAYPTYAQTDISSVIGEEHALVHVCLRLRDPRVLPQRVPSAEVLASLAETAARCPAVRFVVSGAVLAEVTGRLDLFRLPNVWVETAHIQHPMHSLRKLVDLVGPERVLFGTNAPLFYPEAAVFRLEHAPLSDSERRMIASDNALRLLGET
jgi:hypothetical protein